MDEPYRLFKRQKTYYAEHRETGKQTSLKTKDRSIAHKKLSALNDSKRQPFVNNVLAKAYLDLQDPEIAKRTWAVAIRECSKRGGENTQQRNRLCYRTKHFDPIRKKKIIATTSADFLAVIESGGTATNCYLRKLHNFVLAMGWLPTPILPKAVWPKPVARPKRAITREEHELIVSTETNEEHRRFYELMWETGGAQGDVAAFSDKNLTIFREWTKRMVAAIRKHDKTHLITMGMLPFPGAYKVAAEQLDFVSPHLYPKSGKVKEELELLQKFDWGKPIVIGETFPLRCGADDQRDFLLKSRNFSHGWIGHWPDESPVELAALKKSGKATIHNAIWLSWVKLSEEIGPQMTGQTSP